MGRNRAAVAADEFEQREVDDPHRLHTAFAHGWPPKVEPERTENDVRATRLTRDDQYQVAGGRAERGDDRALLVRGQELGDGRLQLLPVAHPHPDEAGGTEFLGPVDERVEGGAARIAR